MAERTLGDVNAYLTAQRGSGVSHRDIAMDLISHGIPTNQGTVWNWCQRLGIA